MEKLIVTYDPEQTTDIELYQILVAMTKEALLKIVKRLDLWVSPNYGKTKTAERLSGAILDNPLEVVTRLAKSELQLLDELVKAGANHGVKRKIRKSRFMLQKLGLVVTYEDYSTMTWTLFMPDEVREALAPHYGPFLDMALKGLERPSARDLRFMTMLDELTRGNGKE